MGTKERRVQASKQNKQVYFDNYGITESTAKTQNKYKESYGYKQFELTAKQLEFKNIIKSNILTFCEGPAGVGKTMTALHYAVEEYLKETGMNIIIIRTPVEVGSDKVGFLPSDLKEKLAPHFSSSKILLESLLSPQKVQADMEGPNKRIQFIIPNYLIGSTWDNCLLIVDEAQQIQPLIMKLILERIGVKSKLIVLGDPTQLYTTTKDRHGMRDAMSRFFRENADGELVSKYPDIGYYKFDADDCMRSDIVKTVLKAYS